MLFYAIDTLTPFSLRRRSRHLPPLRLPLMPPLRAATRAAARSAHMTDARDEKRRAREAIVDIDYFQGSKAYCRYVFFRRLLLACRLP